MSNNTNTFETVSTSTNTLEDANTNNAYKFTPSKLNNNYSNNSSIKNGGNESIQEQTRSNDQNCNISDANEKVFGLIPFDSNEVENRNKQTNGN